MQASSAVLRLTDIVEAIERIRNEMAGLSLEIFEGDWRKRWIVERGIEIISEASRHLPGELKARHPQIPWQKVASIGNVLRHEYERIRRAVAPGARLACRIGGGWRLTGLRRDAQGIFYWRSWSGTAGRDFCGLALIQKRRRHNVCRGVRLNRQCSTFWMRTIRENRRK